MDPYRQKTLEQCAIWRAEHDGTLCHPATGAWDYADPDIDRFGEVDGILTGFVPNMQAWAAATADRDEQRRIEQRGGRSTTTGVRISAVERRERDRLRKARRRAEDLAELAELGEES
jgi:hypothetical protein